MLEFDGSLAPVDATELQLDSNGAVTLSQVRHILKAETGTSDTLVTLNVDTDVSSGYGGIYILQAYPTHVITIDDGGDNITTGNNADLVLEGDARLVVEYDGSNDDFKVIGAIARPGAFTITNWTEDRTLDCNASSADINADVIGTIVKALIESGLLEGAVST